MSYIKSFALMMVIPIALFVGLAGQHPPSLNIAFGWAWLCVVCGIVVVLTFAGDPVKVGKTVEDARRMPKAVSSFFLVVNTIAFVYLAWYVTAIAYFIVCMFAESIEAPKEDEKKGETDEESEDDAE